MKHLLLVFTLSVLSLSACMGASAPGGGTCKQGVCVKIVAIEPIRYGEPVTVTITITSEKDISNLGVSLYHDVDVMVEEPPSGEKGVKDQTFWKGGASWRVDAKANSHLTFTRKVRFPPREGLFTIVANASTPSLHAADSIDIYVTREGGKVYLSGTPLPITPFVMKTPPPYILNPQGTPLPIPTRAGTPPTPTRRPYP
jgi:hypothetical protein